MDINLQEKVEGKVYEALDSLPTPPDFPVLIRCLRDEEFDNYKDGLSPKKEDASYSEYVHVVYGSQENKKSQYISTSCDADGASKFIAKKIRNDFKDKKILKNLESVEVKIAVIDRRLVEHIKRSGGLEEDIECCENIIDLTDESVRKEWGKEHSKDKRLDNFAKKVGEVLIKGDIPYRYKYLLVSRLVYYVLTMTVTINTDTNFVEVDYEWIDDPNDLQDNKTGLEKIDDPLNDLPGNYNEQLQLGP